MEANEIKKGFEDIQNLVSNFKTEHTEAIKNGNDKTVELNEKFEKMTDDMATKIEEYNSKLATIEAMSNQPVINNSEKNEKAMIKHFNDFARLDDAKMTMETYLKNNKIEKNAMSVDSDPDGGYWVLPTYGKMLKSNVIETSPMRQLASVVTIGTDSLILPVTSGEFDSGWVSERASRPVTDNAALKEIEIKTHELYAKPKVTQKMLDDSMFNVETYVSKGVLEKFIRDENTAFVSGNGVTRPRGILTFDNWSSAGTFEFGKIERINSGSAGAFTADGLMDLQNALIENYQSKASWLTRRASFNAIAQLKDGNGQYLFNRNLDKNVGTPFDLLGRPLRFGADMEAVASAAKAIVYADFKTGYQIIDRTGIRVLRDPYTDTPYILFYTTKRVGGSVQNFDAIKIGVLSA